MRKLTDKEKEANEIKRKVARYVKAVEDFIKRNNGGEMPVEFEASMQALEVYYKLFLQLNCEIDRLESLMIVENGRTEMHPLLKSRDSVMTKLDLLLKSLAVTFREQTKMKIIDVSKPETNPLDEWMAKEVR